MKICTKSYGHQQRSASVRIWEINGTVKKCIFLSTLYTLISVNEVQNATCLVHTIQYFKKKFKCFFAHKNMKKPASEFAHNRPQFFFSVLPTGYSIVKDSSVDLGVNSKIVQIRPTVKAVSTKISKKFFAYLSIFWYFWEKIKRHHLFYFEYLS